MSAFARVLLTGGGTAGHVNPALAIGRALDSGGTTFLYVGVAGRAEAEVVPREGMAIRFVRSAPFPGIRPSLAWVSFVLNLLVGTLAAAWLIRRFAPDVIVGTGGYASAPVMFAAAGLRRLGLCRARVYVHEQNAAPGLLNLVVGRLADRVFVSFAETLGAFPANGVLAGYPLRRRIQPTASDDARAALDFVVPPGRQVVFAFGGSQGARTINRAVVDALADLMPLADRLFIIHGTGLRTGGAYDAGAETDARLTQRYGKAERQVIDTFYVRRPYFHGIEHVYGLTDLAVVRGGAGTLNELAAVGVPAVIIPKANLPGEHQVMNARALARCGGAEVLYEETRLSDGHLAEAIDGHVLAATIRSLLGDPERLQRMRHAARSFAPGDAVGTIRAIVEADACGLPVTVPAAPASVSESVLLSNGVLAAKLERAHLADPVVYRVSDLVTSPDDRAYYVSRAASLMASESWDARNLGVKLIGLLQAVEKLPLVLALLDDRRPAAWYKRLLGGDFEQVGFIRRNAMTALARLAHADGAVERALLAGLRDPYFEARAEAARACATLSAGLSASGRQSLVAALTETLHDRWIEVAAAAAQALGHVGHQHDARPELLALHAHHHWLVRSAALRGLLTLVERGEAGDLADVERQIRGFVLTATDFRPEFLIKTSYGLVLDAIRRRKEGSA